MAAYLKWGSQFPLLLLAQLPLLRLACYPSPRWCRRYQLRRFHLRVKDFTKKDPSIRETNKTTIKLSQLNELNWSTVFGWWGVALIGIPVATLEIARPCPTSRNDCLSLMRTYSGHQTSGPKFYLQTKIIWSYVAPKAVFLFVAGRTKDTEMISKSNN